MEVTPIMSHDSRFMIPPGVAHKLARGADGNANAIVVGNRAGVIEWANDAWTRVTGYALDESISKPVLSFLRNVDVGPGIVDFVADCFRQGKVCEVEVPLTTPKGEFLWIQLRVEPLRGADAEVSDFIAIATDITERKHVQASNAVAETDLSVLAARAAQTHGPVLGPCTDLDLGLAEDLPLVLADASLIEGLIGRLICRAAVDVADGWGTVSISTGVLGARPGPLFIGDLFQGLRGGHYAFVEVHDTGGGEPALPTPRDPLHDGGAAGSEPRRRAAAGVFEGRRHVLADVAPVLRGPGVRPPVAESANSGEKRERVERSIDSGYFEVEVARH
jgi:PAS domain S-box-containing protein